MTERKYLLTFAELLDRLSIVLLKRVFIEGNGGAYRNEMELIEHDINMELNAYQGKGNGFSAYDFRMVMLLMLSNRWIWENEAAVRRGDWSSKDTLAARLSATHSINGIRNACKNKLAQKMGERVDLKVDCLAADLPKEFGHWDVFD